MVVVCGGHGLGDCVGSGSLSRCARHTSGMRLDLAGVAVVFDGCARQTRSDVSTYFFRAASDQPATARDLVGGVLVALLAGGGFGLRNLHTGNIRGVLAWLVGALFTPTLALALGVWSGTGKPFEILYTLLWYVGPMHAIPQLDFMGSAAGTSAIRYPVIYLALAGVFGVAALAGRPRQLHLNNPSISHHSSHPVARY